MVVNREEKPDVYADFALDSGVRDNSQRLNREIDEIRPTSRRGRRKGGDGDGDDDDDDDEDLRIQSSKRQNGERGISLETENEGGSTIAGRGINRFPNLSRRIKKLTGASRSGTTITTSVIQEEDESYDTDDEVLVPAGKNDVEEGEDDDDSYIGPGPTPTPRRRDNTDVITRSSTGMPIGGMIVNRDSSNSVYDSDFHWVSPHSADAIFHDFPIDEIAEEYQKLHRKINFGFNLDDSNKLEDEDELEQNEQVLGIRVRYRSLMKLWLDNFPRTHSFIVKIALPLIILVVCSKFLGQLLAYLEIDNEIENNDNVVRTLYKIDKTYEATMEVMLALPTLCYNLYFDEKTEGNQTLNNSMSNLLPDQSDFDFLVDEVSTKAGQEFPDVSPGFSDVNDTLDELSSYLGVCDDAGKVLIDQFKSVSNEKIDSISSQSMTFNWMRCWNTNELHGVNPFRPSQQQIIAAANQSAFYEEQWNLSRMKLYEEYSSNCTDEFCDHVAFNQWAVGNATGSDMCGINKGASAWFWFVVMTTVGYGNVSPSTIKGRWLVGGLGWFFVILWAVLLYLAGRVLGIIIDDFFRKCHCRAMTGNLPSVIVWGTISFLWIIVVSEQYMVFINYSRQPEDFRYMLFGLTKDTNGTLDILEWPEAMWFSYISLLTVGLGDFYPDPAPFFESDLLHWSSSFLIGFTFLSTFLGQIADVVNNTFPDSGDTLKERLLNTNLVGKKEVQYKKENEKGIEKLEKLVEIMDDDDKEMITQRVTRIRVKKNLLARLLHQSRVELDHYKRQGERYDSLSYARVCQEEQMLADVLANTTKEREKLEAYRDGKGHSSAVSAMPAPDEDHSFFDDGTMKEGIESKLKLRKGNKSAKKNLKPNWYT